MRERLLSEKIKKDGLASVIKYEGDNETLVWKHPIEDFNMGSQLIVHESKEAIFFRDGQTLDLFGAGRYSLEAQQLPILEKFYQLPTDTEGTFHSEVYYINKTIQYANRSRNIRQSGFYTIPNHTAAHDWEQSRDRKANWNQSNS